MDKIGIVIPCFNRKATTLACLDLLSRIEQPDFETRVFVVDDGSTDGTGSAIRAKYGDRVVLLTGTGDLWWTGAVNLGVARAIRDNCHWLHIMNDDIEFDRSFLAHLYRLARVKSRSVVGSITCDMDFRGLVIRGGVVIDSDPRRLFKEHRGGTLVELADMESFSVDAVSGRSVLIPADLFKEIGLFDQDRFPHQFADFDFFFRAKAAGWRILVCPGSRIYTRVEKKFNNLLVEHRRWKSICDLWLDNRFFGIKTLFFLARSTGKNPLPFTAREILRKAKWSLMRTVLATADLKRKLASVK